MTSPAQSGGPEHHEGVLFDPAEHRPSGRALRRVGIAVSLVFVGLAVAGIVPRLLHSKAMDKEQREAASEIPRVRVARAERAAPKKGISLPGSVQPLQETAIYARASGYVRRWLVDIGVHVNRGQALVVLDIPDIDEQLRQAQAAANQARAAIAQAKGQLALARTTDHRYSTLAPSGLVSKQDLEQAQSSLAVQQANLEAAEAAHLSAEANVHRYEDLRSFGTIVAPFDGVVTSGTGMGQPLFKVAEVDIVRIFVNVPQLYSAGIREGMDALATVREMPGRVFAGKVARTANELDTSTRTLLTEVDIPNPDRALVAGMYATVSLELRRQDNPVYIPSTSVFFDREGTRVAVIRDGLVSWRNVAIDSDSGDRLAVSTGVAEGDMVAVTPSERLVDGARVLTEELPSKEAPKPAAKPSASATSASGGKT